MKRLPFVIVATLLFAPLTHSEDRSPSEVVTLKNVRHHFYPTHTRVVLDFDRPPLYKITEQLLDSKLLSIHLAQTVLAGPLKEKPGVLLNGPLTRIEVNEDPPEGLVVLLAFQGPGEPHVMVLTQPDRLVLDLPSPSEEKSASEALGPSASSKPAPPIQPPVLAGIQTIVIDPGHGGSDPGAIGPNGLTEAKVVLNVARRVKKLIEQRLQKKVMLTRDQDTLIPLHDRAEMANKNNADLFISIHANASQREGAHGIETYRFGRATDPEALTTAARENATNIKTAQNFQEMILNDLQRDFTLNAALELAHYTQGAFVKTVLPRYPTHSLGVKEAPFYVLAHTKMPAILIEISFISNIMEEQRLRQSTYRQKIAESIFHGIKEYMKQ